MILFGQSFFQRVVLLSPPTDSIGIDGRRRRSARHFFGHRTFQPLHSFQQIRFLGERSFSSKRKGEERGFTSSSSRSIVSLHCVDERDELSLSFSNSTFN